jgi:hypothetical protein
MPEICRPRTQPECRSTTPHTHRYQVTDTGLQHAAFLARVHDRILRAGLADLHDPTPTRLRAASRTYQAALDQLTRQAGIAA